MSILAEKIRGCQNAIAYAHSRLQVELVEPFPIPGYWVALYEGKLAGLKFKLAEMQAPFLYGGMPE